MRPRVPGPKLIPFLFLLLLSGVLLVAAWRDLAVRLLPNGLSLGALAAGLALRLPAGIEGMAASLLAAALVFGLFFMAWLLGGMGGADVKLGAAVAVGLPAAAVPAFLLLTAFAGLLVALPFLLLGRRAPHHPVVPAGRAAGLPARVARAEWRRLRRRGPLPYAVAIAVGGIITHSLLFRGM